MADPWDGILLFDNQGRIKVLDRNLAAKIQRLYQQEIKDGNKWVKHKDTLTIFYETDSIPKQEVNTLCICR